ncbi:hypothetical protein K9N68_10835 [Kovacikia minuta CCNUW1]|uniref:hypothetical protein n=1 Tax=Kovacikia minuta TaxID=2931930 RepID=UPI001CC92A5F|nr:hypothetical protein [Kovacikia minuta]UBF28324.1 hypothetical protein K9N68_10835 [Kovacikia minuta CCNUW1]
MERLFPEFSDTLNWNLVARESYQVERVSEKSYNPISLKYWLIEDSYVLMIGVKSGSSEPRWYLGAWAAQLLLFTPSATTIFTASVHAAQRRVRLNHLNLCVFPKIQSQWMLQVKFPWWFEDVQIEIWKYDGADIDLFQRVDQIENAVNSL